MPLQIISALPNARRSRSEIQVEARMIRVRAVVTHMALGSEKTSAWMCIIRSPPAAYSMTKQTCSCVWKHANRLTRNGWRTLLTVSKILFSHIRLGKRGGDRVSRSSTGEDKESTPNYYSKDGIIIFTFFTFPISALQYFWHNQ